VTNSSQFRIVQATPAAAHDAGAARKRLCAQQIPEALRDFRESARTFEVTEALEVAINTALAVGAPLLVTGEPGTGKTQIAYYLGWYFGIEVHAYQVRSTSVADDMKFDFDAVAYLRAAQHPEEDGRRERSEFVQKKALWLAYESREPCVLLVDEIDKAPRDFPNDLLLELDKHEFRHPFREEMIRPQAPRPPLVVITSNAERRLPDAFLRRCIFHHIVLDEDLIRRAVRARARDFPRLDDATTGKAIERFWEIRKRDAIQKPPGTGELLVWLSVLSARGSQARDLEGHLADLPALGALIKDHQDLESLRGS
jgi:MoxR-like ATPase